MSSGLQLQYVLRESEIAIGHVVLQMDDALGPSGRARRIHPERHLVPVGVSLRQLCGKCRQPLFGDDRMRHRVIAGRAVDHDQRPQRRIRAGRGIEARAKFGIADGNGSIRIRQVELQQIGRRQRIDQQRHKTGADRAKERRRIGRSVVEKHQDAIAALQPQRDKAVAPARGLRAELAVAARTQGAGQRQPVVVPPVEIIEQDAAGIIGLRDRKADFPRARAVGGHGIGDCKCTVVRLRIHRRSPIFRAGRDAS